MTVAASTHDRGATRRLTLGNGATYQGLGVGGGRRPGPARRLLRRRPRRREPHQHHALLPRHARPGEGDRQDRRLRPRSQRPRRQEPAVKQAGGVGMVLANTSAAQSLNADFHSVPSIHVDSASGAATKAYVDVGTATRDRDHLGCRSRRRCGRRRWPASRPTARRSPAVATCSSPTSPLPASTSSRRSRRPVTRAATTSTPSPARRCRHRTSPASRRSSCRRTRRGRRRGSSRPS